MIYSISKQGLVFTVCSYKQLACMHVQAAKRLLFGRLSQSSIIIYSCLSRPLQSDLRIHSCIMSAEDVLVQPKKKSSLWKQVKETVFFKSKGLTEIHPDHPKHELTSKNC
jgi:hypothetical protein